MTDCQTISDDNGIETVVYYTGKVKEGVVIDDVRVEFKGTPPF